MSKLVLTRKAGQSVKIGHALELTIRETQPAKVYLSTAKGAHWFRLGDVVEMTDVKVTICAINKGVVKLLFEADRSVTIVRSELVSER